MSKKDKRQLHDRDAFVFAVVGKWCPTGVLLFSRSYVVVDASGHCQLLLRRIHYLHIAYGCTKVFRSGKLRIAAAKIKMPQRFSSTNAKTKIPK
jgi:hypothetical protein